MIQQSECPSAEQMELLLRQPLPPDQANALASHVEDCPRCGEIFDGLLAGDPLANQLRMTPFPVKIEHSIARLMEILKGLGNSPQMPAEDSPVLKTTRTAAELASRPLKEA